MPFPAHQKDVRGYFLRATAVPSQLSSIGVGELRRAFADFHPQVRHVLDACPSVHKWALVDRDPLPRWCDGNVTLLGDACHPMTPYMAQGAAMAIEDAAVLSRCLDGVDRNGVASAFRRFEATRRERTSRIQLAHARIRGSKAPPIRIGSTATMRGRSRWPTPNSVTLRCAPRGGTAGEAACPRYESCYRDTRRNRTIKY
jgi:2-polyprenyl-6-methoxyphenol hydroxylase-like FAD-dependent oxidoreductase